MSNAAEGGSWREGAEACRRAYEAYSAGDFATLLELFAEDVVVYVAPPNFESGTYQGRDEYRRLIERWGAVWEEMSIEVDEIGGAGEWILARVTYRGRVSGSPTAVEQPSWEASLWQGGQCRRYEVYFDPEQGKAAFGSLRESRQQARDDAAGAGGVSGARRERLPGER